MYCRLLLKLILRDKAVWICTLVLAAAFSVPIAFNSPIYGPFFMKQGMQGFVDAFNTRAPQASGTDLSPEQQNDAELARYANAALAAQTDAAFLDSAESYYALMGEGFQSGSIVGDRETNDADLAYCRALSSSGITDIPASASDLPFLSFLPYAIATAPSFLPFIPFLLSSILVLGATRPGTLAAKAPAPKFRRLIQIVFSIIAAGTAMLLAGLAPGGIYALALNGFGQIGYPIAFFHDGALATTTAGNVFTALLIALLAGGTLISVCSAVLSTATRRVLAGPLTSALLVAAPAFPLLSDSALEHNAALNLLPLAVFSPIEATGYVGCFPTEFIGSGSGSASMLAVALAYVAVLFAVGAVATRSPKQPGPAKKHHGLELLDASVGYGSTTILSIGSLLLSPGTAAGLVAPNGSGKTTLLEALSGQFPTRIRSGSLAADGICQRRSAEFAELVYLSSSGGTDLYPTLSAIEHLAFVREAWKSAADIDSLCDSLGISPYLDKPTRKLSTGMKQQVKLAMAISTDCPYLILDEPLNGLDPGKRKTPATRCAARWRGDEACSFQAICSTTWQTSPTRSTSSRPARSWKRSSRPRRRSSRNTSIHTREVNDMKLFEQLKSNASRMAVYAILVATALCGIAAPVYALNGEKGDVEPAYMASTVKDRYKAFSGDTFYVAEYDTTYRQLRYNKGYDYLGAEAISYTSGWYRSSYGHITQFKCNYRVYN